MILELEAANALPMIPGPNVAAAPTIELAFRKLRRDLVSGCVVAVSSSEGAESRCLAWPRGYSDSARGVITP